MKKLIFPILMAFLLWGNSASATTIFDIVRGRILLQVENYGEAWYVSPDNDNRYYLGRPDDAFELMRTFGLGIKHSELMNYLNSTFPNRLSGKIMIDVDLNGEAFYVYPVDLKGYYLGRPADAFTIMRNLGLGITNQNLEKIAKGGGTLDPQKDSQSLDAGDYKNMLLAVPYVHEAPDGNWVDPWKNACEEASITMVENYYKNNLEVTISEAKDFMNMLFTKQDELWGSNYDADAYRMKKLIDDYTSFNAVIKTDPTIEDIQAQLNQGNPIISLHYGKLLYNANIPFLAVGSYYHVMVIIGYDDDNQQFITHDDGDIATGNAHRYDYGLFMNSLHDFDFTTRKADGPPTVIFTSLKKPDDTN